MLGFPRFLLMDSRFGTGGFHISSVRFQVFSSGIQIHTRTFWICTSGFQIATSEFNDLVKPGFLQIINYFIFIINY